MNIREYEEKDYKIIGGLLNELQLYLVRLDPDRLNIITDDFFEVYTNNMLRKINDGKGKIYLAEEENEITGFIAGIIENYDEDDKVTYKCPIEGRIIELIVTEKFRNKSIGSNLICRIEEYFRNCNCETMRVNVFSNNSSGHDFYVSHNFKPRTEDLIKIL